MATTEYHLTPLPANARPPVGWIALCLISLFASPFLGFALNGKVAELGLVTGLAIAIIPLCGLTAIVILRWLAWRKLPAYIVEEQKLGRVFPAEGAPMIISPVRFSSKDKKDWIEIRSEGMTMPSHTLLRMQGVPDFMAKVWVTMQTEEMFVAWSDITEWAVDTDSDGPNYYRLQVQPKGALAVRRFAPDAATESDILDAVRSIGKRPVRLRCDVD